MVLMIVSGRSGSGKSVALRALEDMGFYCVDNLPVVLLPDLARTLADREISAAVSMMFVICRSHQKYSNRR